MMSNSWIMQKLFFLHLIACPPGMYRPQKDPLCQLCPKGLYSDQFGSASCVRCPLYHTTRGLGSRKASQCYYHRSATRSRMVDRQKKGRKKGPVEASFMYYNRWMSRRQQKRTWGIIHSNFSSFIQMCNINIIINADINHVTRWDIDYLNHPDMKAPIVTLIQ